MQYQLEREGGRRYEREGGRRQGTHTHIHNKKLSDSHTQKESPTDRHAADRQAARQLGELHASRAREIERDR
jgi:hypothetical protein